MLPDTRQRLLGSIPNRLHAERGIQFRQRLDQLVERVDGRSMVDQKLIEQAFGGNLRQFRDQHADLRKQQVGSGQRRRETQDPAIDSLRV